MMMGAEARTPIRRISHVGDVELFVSSSIAPNKPLFNRGDTAGPFAVGQELTLTCSTQYSPGVLLSWWEDGSQLSAVSQEDGGITSVSITVGILALQDSGRHFTCREKETEMTKSIELEVQQVENNVKERNPLGWMPYKLPVFSITTLVIILLVLVVVVDLHIKNRSQAKKSAGTKAIKKRAAVGQGSRNIIIGAARGKRTGKQNNFSILVNEEDFDDSPVEVVRAAVTP